MYDVIMIGGGVSGAASAATLADQGLRVLLCDRTQLPAPAVSTHFFGPSVLLFLEQLGVLEEVLATGAPPLRRWHVEVEGGYYGGPMLPRSAHPYNMCVRRETLDAILLRAAKARGVEIRERCSVRSLVIEDGRVTGVAGAGWSEQAQVVVGADGRGSLVARQAGAAMAFDAGARRCTFHAYWRGVTPLPAPSLELWHDGGDLIQLGPCDGDLWVVMVSAPPERFAKLRGAAATGTTADGGGETAATPYEERLKAIPPMRTRLASAKRMSPIYGSGQLRNFERQPAGPGWRLVGDAYCHKDPLYGAGIADSCVGARTLAETLPESGPAPENQYSSAMQERIGQRMRAGLDSLQIDPPDPGQLAWIQGVLAHPAFAFEMTIRCSDLFAGLPADRREFWQKVADSTADLLGLPAPTRIVKPSAPRRPA